MEFTKEYFEEASKAWMKNKRKLKDCYYVYTCSYVDKDGNKCKNDIKYRSNHSCVKHYWKLINKI